MIRADDGVDHIIRNADNTVGDLTYQDMKDKINKIFGDPLEESCENGAVLQLNMCVSEYTQSILEYK